MQRTDYFFGCLALGKVFFLFTCFVLFFIQCGYAFDTLRSYDNATLLQFKCPIKLLFCSGKLSNVSAVKIKKVAIILMRPRLMRNFVSLETNFCKP